MVAPEPEHQVGIHRAHDEAAEFAPANFVRLCRAALGAPESVRDRNELTHSRLYHLIPAGGPGTNGDNYAQTDYGYDSAGRQNQVTSPGGTFERKPNEDGSCEWIFGQDRELQEWYWLTS